MAGTTDEKILFLPLNYFYSSVKSQLAVVLWVSLWIHYAVSLIYVSVSPPVSHSLECCRYRESNSAKTDSFHFVFPFTKLFCLFSFLCLSIYLRKNLSISAKTLAGF